MLPPLKERLIVGLQKYPEDCPKLSIKAYEGMGLGVMAEEHIQAGTFIMPHTGDLVSPKQMSARNKMYEENEEGSYYIEIQAPYKGQRWVMDGTRHHG